MMAGQKLASERVVVSAPMSFAGSAQRIWKLTEVEAIWLQVLMIVVAVTLIAVVWSAVLCWYMIFGLLLVPYRLLRRGSRKRKVAALRHREQLAQLQKLNTTQERLLAQQPSR